MAERPSVNPLTRTWNAVWRPTPGSLRLLALLGVIGNVVIVVSGGAVRVTKSGLGCPDWPRCTGDSLVPTHNPEHHVLNMSIEFGNRLITFVVLGIGVLVFVAALRLRPRRRDLVWWALAQPMSVVAQAVIGGIVVLTELHPAAVSLHFLVSPALLVFCVALWVRAGEGTRRPGGSPAPGRARWPPRSWSRAPPCSSPARSSPAPARTRATPRPAATASTSPTSPASTASWRGPPSRSPPPSSSPCTGRAPRRPRPGPRPPPLLRAGRDHPRPGRRRLRPVRARGSRVARAPAHARRGPDVDRGVPPLLRAPRPRARPRRGGASRHLPGRGAAAGLTRVPVPADVSASAGTRAAAPAARC
ncbi:COX15/CtaA family protein [Actinomadura madurae]|uniref:COX15/CtaA family protein n=1 Tax=Actinomadura madurae TaxID=1993 RepID=UPI0020D24E84|nr:COX15/CtaA family protein [Actinomadura madurae]MCQ0013364.1 COX15/CtaA family protein [Actinomadura madurae]